MKAFHTINFPILTAFKEEQLKSLYSLFDVELILSHGKSDDFERYTRMGLQIAPNDPYTLKRNGICGQYF